MIGNDVSGVVVETGPGADDFRPGDEVWYPAPVFAGQGTYAEFHVVDQALVARTPEGLSHVEAAGPGIAEIATWRGQVHFPPRNRRALDRTGRLTAAARELAAFDPPEPVATAQQLTDELANWTLMLAYVQARGEYARAHNLLHAVVAPLQLKLCRLLRGSTAHWLTPSRALEADLPGADVERYAATTGPLTPEAVRTATANSWEWRPGAGGRGGGPLGDATAIGAARGDRGGAVPGRVISAPGSDAPTEVSRPRTRNGPRPSGPPTPRNRACPASGEWPAGCRKVSRRTRRSARRDRAGGPW